jgi:endonuclease/exonuclease/phosphatase family metal-dependent hydrolase
VNLIGLHLKSERGGHESDAKRIAQASVVRRYHLPLVKGGEHVIVAGDLNDHRGQPSIVDACGLETVQPGFPRQDDPLVSDHRPILVRLAFP